MSWSVSGQAKKEEFGSAVDGLQVQHELGEGSAKQLEAAKAAAKSLVEAGAVSGENFNVSLSGHCQADSPGSSTDSVYVSVSAFEVPQSEAGKSPAAE